MKNLIVLTVGLLSMTIACLLSYSLGKNKAQLEQQAMENNVNQDPNEGVIFIWDADLEAIPAEGGLIQVDSIIKDTVYIGPTN